MMTHKQLEAAELEEFLEFDPSLYGEKADLFDERRMPFERPGRLLNDIKLHLHTQDAQVLFGGYQSKKIVGLLKFGKQMKRIWNAAALDDPYADLYLLKIYEIILKLRKYFSYQIEKFQTLLTDSSHNENLEITPFISESPVVKKLWFSTQYGFMGAQFIADFDLLMCIFLTACHVGVFLGKTHEMMKKESMQLVEQLFQSPFVWEKTGVTRKDVREKTRLAKKVQVKLGEIPEAILKRELRSPFAPYIRVVDEDYEIAQSSEMN